MPEASFGLLQVNVTVKARGHAIFIKHVIAWSKIVFHKKVQQYSSSNIRFMIIFITSHREIFWYTVINLYLY